MTSKKIVVLTTGGTIASAQGEAGLSRSGALSGEELLEMLQIEAAVDARVEVRTLLQKPSNAITLGDLLKIRSACEAAAAEPGVVGVVVTHGTDTLEETAYLLDLLWDRAEPLVVTGAMRQADVPSTDAPANLLAAARVALDPEARGRGVLVVLDDAVHLAARVTKESSTALDAFVSPGTGPVGRLHEHEPRFHAPAPPRPEPLPDPPPGTVDVALVEAPFADDGRMVRALLDAGYEALVVAGSGLGHVSAATYAELAAAVARGVVVVVASRTARGGTGRSTYGYVGSETRLIEAGVLMAGELSGPKARLLLHVLRAAGYHGPRLAAALAARTRA